MGYEAEHGFRQFLRLQFTCRYCFTFYCGTIWMGTLL